MKKPPKIIRLSAEVLGYFCLLIITCLIGNNIWNSTKSKSSKASFSDVRHLLNWSGIKDENYVAVLSSYESGSVSFDGDHFNAYKIQVTSKNSPTVNGESSDYSKWRSLPLDNFILEDGLRMALSFRQYVKWLPSVEEIKTKNYIVSFNKLVFYKTHCEFAGIFIFNPDDHILYYIESAI